MLYPKLNTPQDLAVLGLMTSGLDCWIGLDDKAAEGTFVWTEDGSTPVYTNWYPNNPSPHTVQNCVKKKFLGSSNVNNGKWDDVGCGKLLNYACSMAAIDSCASMAATTVG